MARCPTCGHPSCAGWDDGALELVLEDGRRREFTRQEWLLLTELRRHIGQLVPHEALLAAMYRGREDGGADADGLNVKIARIRNKLLGTGWRVSNRFAVGYRLEAI